jgi:glutathionylspermidine synthase
MLQEEFAPHAIDTYPSVRWIEPIWKMLLSNKGILPILWQLYPDHELLLESHFAEPTPNPDPQVTSPTTNPGNPSTNPGPHVTSPTTNPGNPPTNLGPHLTSPSKNPGAPRPDSRTWVSTPPPHSMKNYVRKPLMSREGANITLIRDNAVIASTPGPYNGRQIVQALAPEAVFNNRHPILGLWMIDQDCSGLGIRESAGPITDNLSSFVPHYFL